MSAVPRRPARKQVEVPVTGHEEVHAAGTVNLWTGRVLKEYRKPRENRKKEASQYRCHPKLDSGWTRGAAAGSSYCCLYFARGICHHGPDCNYLHRLPSATDEERHRTDYANDIFGRERVPEKFDGRKKGVGSYERECKTLYVNYGGAGTLPTEQLRTIVADNFAEWGPLENVHLVPSKTLAFIRFQWRSSAEFAKPAMHQQTLRGCDTTEILDVRWANDDPNPHAVARVHHEREEAMRDAYVKAVNELAPEAKRARIQQLHLANTVCPGAATAAYPDTDAQYGGGDGGYQHQYEGWDSFLYQQQPRYQQYQQPGADGGSGEEEEQQQQEGQDEEQQDEYEADEAGQWAAWQQWQQQYPGGYYPSTIGPGEDDYSRYLRPQDWQALAAAEQAAAEQQQQQGSPEQQHEQQDADEVAQEALGLIGGYGSDSDDGRDGGSGKGGGDVEGSKGDEKGAVEKGGGGAQGG